MIRVDLTGLHGLLDGLASIAEESARPAAFEASQVLYAEVRKNVAKIQRKTGNLERGVYQAYSKSNSGPGHATYHISWNARKAPHGGLVEFGHIQRYVSYLGSDGRFYTAVRPEMRGKPKPGRRASQSAKDAYFVRLPVPLQVAAQPFVRPAATKFPEALAAAHAYLMKALT